MVRHLLHLLLMWLAACSAVATPLQVTATPVPLEKTAPNRRQVDRLEYRAGFQLSSTDDRFDSISGFELTHDRSLLIAVTDRGYWITLRLSHSPDGVLTGVAGGQILPMLGNPGEILTRNGHRRDAEDLTRLSDGTLVVSFEHDHRIVHYAPLAQLGGPQRLQMQALSHGHSAPANGGVETLVALPGDRLLAIREKAHTHDGRHHGWIVDKTGREERHFTYQGADSFEPTGACRLKDGTILLMERRFNMTTGIWGRISHFDERGARAGKKVAAIELARFGPPLVVDNFEAISAHELSADRATIYLGSDDNVRNLDQRTLLLQLEWRREKKTQPPPP